MKRIPNSILALVAFVLLYAITSSGLISASLGLGLPQAIALAVLAWAALMWITEWLPLFVTSLGILALQITWLLPALAPKSVKVARQEFYSPFFSDIILLFLGGFVLAALLHKYRLDNLLAAWLLKRTGDQPARVMAGVMAVSAILSMWMSNTATTAMMFAIILPLMERIPADNPFGKALALSIPFACNLGGLGTPIGTPPNAIALSYLSSKGMALSFTGWMLAAIPFMLVLLVLLWVILLQLFPPGGIRLNLEFESHHQWKASHVLVLSVFFLTILGWMTSDFHGLSAGTVGLFPLLVAFGGGLLQPKDFKALPWDVLFMVGGGICLGVGLSKSGLTQEVAKLLPKEGGGILVLTVFVLLAALMTTFMSNTATANILIPLGMSANQGVGLLAVAIAMTCSTAMALPVSTPPNAIAFGSGILTSRDMIRPGLAITLLSILLLLVMGSFYLPLLGL